MKAFAAAALAGWVVLRVLRFRWPWPWRAVDLVVDRDEPDRWSGAPTIAPGSEPSVRVGPGILRPSSRRRRQRQIANDLPLAADLLRVAVSAGHSVNNAVAVAAEFGNGPVCEAFASVHRRVRRGASLHDELAALPDRLGAAVRPLSGTLILALSSGAPAGPALQRLADAERTRARRQAEARVRRLPVLLLAPLMGLILPAFLVLAIVPVVLVTAEADLAAAAAPGQGGATSRPSHATSAPASASESSPASHQTSTAEPIGDRT